MRVDWIAGPPGSGKSRVAWELFRSAPEPVSYVDIDQVGMLYPRPDDIGEALPIESLRALVPTHSSAGSPRIVVSGVITRAQFALLRTVPGLDSRVVALRIDREERRRRLGRRGADSAFIAAALAPADDEAVERSADAVLDADGLDPTATSARVATLFDRTATSGSDDAPMPLNPGSPVPPLTWIRGSRAVGTSSVGFRLLLDRSGRGLPTSFLDPRQLTFARGATVPRVDAVRAVAAHHGRRGSTEVIVVGALDSAELRLLRERGGEVRVVRVTADDEVIARRVLRRAGGGPPELAGDDLVGRAGTSLEEAIRAAIADARGIESLPGESVVPTSGLDVAAAADAVRRLLRDP